MIEVPSAAIIGDLLAKEVDFFSIGTNDLIQYLIAVDRVNENVADLYNPVHISVLRMIKKIIEDGHKEGKWVGMCGEMASDPSFTKILIGLGIDELSMSVVSIPKVKSIIRSISYSAAKELADEIMLTDEQEEIKNIIRRDELMKDNL
jgi:phosphotransferase system enzyme I (PtsI)